MKIRATVTPFLIVSNGTKALEFYSNAFGARVLTRYDQPGRRLMAKMAIEDAEWWIGDEEPEGNRASAG